MKPLKITYWISTAIPVMVFATTGTMYLFHAPVMVAKFHELGYPLYVLNILGAAKVLGVTALVVPEYPRLKEWAYAGFVFDLIGAIWSHAAVQGFGQAARLLIPLTIMVTSYITYHRVHDNPGEDGLAA